MAEHWFGAAVVVIDAGQVMTGAMLSITVMVNEQFAVPPSLALMVYSWMFCPMGNNDPDP